MSKAVPKCLVEVNLCKSGSLLCRQRESANGRPLVEKGDIKKRGFIYAFAVSEKDFQGCTQREI